MRPTLLATIVLVLASAGPAAAQRSLFDQPVQAAPETPAAPARPVSPPAAASPATEAPAAPTGEPAAKPRPQAKPRKPRGPIPARSLAVFNGTPNTLVGLEVSQGEVRASLKKALAKGKRTRLALPAFKACEVSVAATFQGEAQGAPSQVDICKEKSLNFRD